MEDRRQCRVRSYTQLGTPSIRIAFARTRTLHAVLAYKLCYRDLC